MRVAARSVRPGELIVLTVTGAEPGRRVAIRLEFLKPWQSVSTTLFTLAPGEAGTRITWAMDGQHNFVGKAASMFMDMDKMVGGDFEKGLAALKAAAESMPKPNAEAAVVAP